MIHVEHNWNQFREPWRSLGPDMCKEVRRVAHNRTFDPPWWDRLYEARTTRGITVKVAAAAIGKSVETIYSAERGENRLSHETVVVLAELYQVPFVALAGAVSRERQP